MRTYIGPSIVDIDIDGDIIQICNILNVLNNHCRAYASHEVLIMTTLLIPCECRALLGRSSLSFPGQQAVSSSCVNQRPYTGSPVTIIV